MVLSEEKRAKLTDILAHLRGMSGGVGTSSHHALASAVAAPSPTSSTPGVAVPLAAAQLSPTPSALELPLVLLHALKGFQLGVTVDSDEAAARERLGFNFRAFLAQSNTLLTRPEPRVVEAKTKEEMSLLASFAAREAALEQELACLRHSEKDLSKQLRTKCREVFGLEARILPLRIRVFELEEAAEVSKSKIAGLERRSINREMQVA